MHREKGLTQKQLAEQLGVSDRTVSKWERGAGFPDVSLLAPLSDALEVPVQCLLINRTKRRSRAITSRGKLWTAWSNGTIWKRGISGFFIIPLE